MTALDRAAQLRDAIRDVGSKAQTLTLVCDEYARDEKAQGDVDDCVWDMEQAIQTYGCVVKAALADLSRATEANDADA